MSQSSLRGATIENNISMVLLLWLGGSHVARGAVVSPHDDGDAADGGSIAA